MDALSGRSVYCKGRDVVLFTYSTCNQLACTHLRSRRETMFRFPQLNCQTSVHKGNFYGTVNVTKSYPLVRGDPFSQKMKPSRGAGWHCAICHKETQTGDLPSAIRVQLGQRHVMACLPSEGRETKDNPRHRSNSSHLTPSHGFLCNQRNIVLQAGNIM